MTIITQFLSPKTVDEILDGLCDYAKECVSKVDKNKVGIAKKEPNGIQSRLITFIVNEQHTYNIQLTVQPKERTKLNIMTIECVGKSINYITDFDFKTLQAKRDGSSAKRFIQNFVLLIESMMPDVEEKI